MKQCSPILFVAICLSGCAGSQEMRRAELRVTLTSQQIIDGNGDPDGTGTALFRVDPPAGRICYELFVRGIDPATAAHVHRGAAGIDGPPVVTIQTPGQDGHSEGCAQVAVETATDIGFNPDQYYVNVHTGAHPGGAIRGQLRGEVRPRRGQVNR